LKKSKLIFQNSLLHVDNIKNNAKSGKNKFIDEMADVASSDEEESLDEEAEIKNHDNQYYHKDALARKFD
jgi:hypothetical protein